MSRLFQTFEFLDRGWEVRALENQSLRSMFLWVLLMAFLSGADTALAIYQIVQLHRFNWSIIMNFAVVGFLTFRYSRTIYRRLKR